MIEHILLGAIQGLTELLPISSSGHLAVVEKILHISEPVATSAFLHFGTLIATVVFFRRRLAEIIGGMCRGERPAWSYAGLIVIGNIPIGLFALFFKTVIEQSFTDLRLIGLFLGLTGVILIGSGFFPRGTGKMDIRRAVLVGLAQMCAVFPGLSRSGFTIASALYARTDPGAAFEFSFLMSLPAILAANLLEIKGLGQAADMSALLVGMAVSFIFGLAALYLLRRLVRKGFHWFGIYCLAASLAIILFLR
jgi:undecaprenyl-diphosphatase